MSTSDRFKLFLFNQEKYVKDLAEELGVTQSALNRVVRGEAMPSSKILVPLAKMGVNINWLLLGEEEMLREKFYLEKHDSPILRNEKVPYQEPIDRAHPLKEAITILQNENKDLEHQATESDLKYMVELQVSKSFKEMHDLLKEQIATYQQLMKQKDKSLDDKDKIIALLEKQLKEKDA
ncbi:helix-turn-helix domain-containing protein [Aureispira anguillae]|uniref:Helix-turn-helix domain-containing protein n=1 Tax=Aureispira anguillae TaxID=2864201 RepID=A0A916DU78_9BACT|nr:helix-turn-helix transcriptional regulator [Aureispira anguillae]BDS13035.1 helix-turn-helix domain-containing protein [Aureispira anguillae]BDS13101.1 helix-turn-helix domain-containing protein [Aureispira anguillae]